MSAFLRRAYIYETGSRTGSFVSLLSFFLFRYFLVLFSLCVSSSFLFFIISNRRGRDLKDVANVIPFNIRQIASVFFSVLLLFSFGAQN